MCVPTHEVLVFTGFQGGQMKGRKGVTRVDVVRACVALVKQGRKIGPQNVRLELGTGSMSTISQHLRALAFRSPAVDLATEAER